MSQLDIDPMDRLIWGGKAFAEILQKPYTQVQYHLERGRLDADKIGRLWVSTPRRLLNSGRKAKTAELSPDSADAEAAQ